MRRGPDQANRKIPFTFQKHAQPGGDRLRGREGVGSGGVVGTLEPSRAEPRTKLEVLWQESLPGSVASENVDGVGPETNG